MTKDSESEGFGKSYLAKYVHADRDEARSTRVVQTIEVVGTDWADARARAAEFFGVDEKFPAQLDPRLLVWVKQTCPEKAKKVPR